MNNDQECCGFGGLFAVKNAPISVAMGEQKMRHIGDSDADVVALCDVSCMTHINGLLSRNGVPVRAVHIAELLTGRVPTPERPADRADAPEVRDRRWQDMRQKGETPAAPIAPAKPDVRDLLPKTAPPESPDRPRRWQDIG